MSTGVIYWAHSFYQLIFVINLNLTLSLLKSKNRTYAYFLLLFAFLGAWTEWTGYIFNFGLALVMWRYRNGRLALSVMIATIIAGIVTILHYGFVIGFSEVISLWFVRFSSRNIEVGFSQLIPMLLGGYGLSYGLFLLTVFLVAIRSVYLLNIGFTRHSLNFSLILFVSFFPLIENLVMLQHATQFSFARLKFIIPAAILEHDRKLFSRIEPIQ